MSLAEAEITRLERADHLSRLRGSFAEFVHEFWLEVPGTSPLRWNWHLDLFCDELQVIAERVFRGETKAYDFVINVSPGTSKSTLFSILFPAWAWTRMPEARVMSASHADTLVLDLSTKSRAVINCERYRDLFPEISLRADQDTKSYYANTKGGDRITCTVAGKSPMGFHAHFIIVDDPIDPKKVLSEAETKTAREFMTNVIPTRKVDKSVTATILVMQRLGVGDPTDVMLEEAKREGAAPLRHVCLPAELEPVSADDPSQRFVETSVIPQELAARYVDGLMDPGRLGPAVLAEYRARGAHFYATQFLQKPYVKGGGMFKDTYFNQRVKAAPWDSKRIRYWDRAATADGGCYTAGVLLAQHRGIDGIVSYYVEHVVHGQWEPTERNQRMRATALRDRAKYGPKNSPRIKVEREGGSAGRDAWKGIASALAGFAVEEDKVTGDKETRAEPWSSQLAAGNVHLVEDGTWDLPCYVEEHCSFPHGRYKDQVDSSSGAFNLFSKGATTSTGFRVMHARSKNATLRLYVASTEELMNVVLEEKCLLVAFRNPPALEGGGAPSLPLHGCNCVLESLVLAAADLDPREHQATWNDLLPPWHRPCRDVMFTPEHGKRLWSLLLKKRPEPCDSVVFCDDGGEDGRALSTALAVCDTLRYPRASTVFLLAGSDRATSDADEPGNRYLYDTVKATRHMVVL